MTEKRDMIRAKIRLLEEDIPHTREEFDERERKIQALRDLP